MSKSPNRLLGIFFGILFAIDGVGGFFLTSDTRFFSNTGPKVLGLFGTNPFHNLVHIVAGVALLIAALVGPRAAKAMNRVVGAGFLLAGCFGLLVSGGANPLNILAINGADIVLDFATAVVLLTVGLGADKVTAPTKAP